MTTRSIVIAQIKQVATEHQKRLAPLTDDLPLLDSGLDSLCLAVIVARLEEELGVDPFNASDDAPFPVTVGDVVALYESAAGHIQTPGTGLIDEPMSGVSSPAQQVHVQKGDAGG